MAVDSAEGQQHGGAETADQVLELGGFVDRVRPAEAGLRPQDGQGGADQAAVDQATPAAHGALVDHGPAVAVLADLLAGGGRAALVAPEDDLQH